MTLRISSELHRQLLAMAAASSQAEICGLLVGRYNLERIVATRNIAADPRRNFEIDPRALFTAIRNERAGVEKLVGYYHSHPIGPPVPSIRDADHATADGRIWLIIGDGRVTAWQMNKTSQFNEIEIHFSA
jgi:desampylase